MWTPLYDAPRADDRWFFGTIRDLHFVGDRLLVITPLGWALHDPETLEVLAEAPLPGLRHVLPLLDQGGFLAWVDHALLRVRWSGDAERLADGTGREEGLAEGRDGSVWFGRARDNLDSSDPHTLNHLTAGGLRTLSLGQGSVRLDNLARSPDGRWLLYGHQIVDIDTGAGGRKLFHSDSGWAGDGLCWSISSRTVSLADPSVGYDARASWDTPHRIGAVASPPDGSILVVATQPEVVVLSVPELTVVETRPRTPLPASRTSAESPVACTATHYAYVDSVSGELACARLGGGEARRGGYLGAIGRSASNGRITVWTGVARASLMRLDHTTGQVSGLNLDRPAEEVAVGPDGSVLVCVEATMEKPQNDFVLLAPDGTQKQEFPGGMSMDCPTFSPDGTRVALPLAGSRKGSGPRPTQVIVHQSGGKKLATVKAPGDIHQVVLDADRMYVANGYYLIAYSGPKAVEAWRWASPGRLDERFYHTRGTSHVWSIAALATDLVMASWVIHAEGRGLSLIDAGQVVRTWPDVSGCLHAHAGRLFLGRGDGRLECWDGDTVTELGRHGTALVSLTSGPHDGQGPASLWSTSADGTVRRWDLPAGVGSWAR